MGGGWKIRRLDHCADPDRSRGYEDARIRRRRQPGRVGMMTILVIKSPNEGKRENGQDN
jgi:hypothetical protein